MAKNTAKRPSQPSLYRARDSAELRIRVDRRPGRSEEEHPDEREDEQDADDDRHRDLGH